MYESVPGLVDEVPKVITEDGLTMFPFAIASVPFTVTGTVTFKEPELLLTSKLATETG